MNDFYSQYYLGKCYEFGNMCEIDYKKAKYWYMCSYKNECDEALVSLGDLYMDGKGFKESVNKAKKYYKKAYELGADEAQEAYGVACLFDKKSQKEGLELLKEFSNSDNYMALSFLSICYKEGIGTEKNDKMAKEIDKKIKGIKK